MIAALLPAAGSGTRLGKGHKAFVPLRGKTLLARCISALCPHVDEIVVALPAAYSFPLGVHECCQGKIRLIHGGATRQESVYQLLAATKADVVLIHDAARPFLPAQVIERLLKAAQDLGAATAALPVADTLVRAQQTAQWGERVERAGLWAVQTPQAFRREALWQAHLQARHEQYEATDDAGLIARLGMAVQLVQGDARLFKITTPSDLALAEALAQVWDTQPEQ